jgi:hypothetical protein
VNTHTHTHNHLIRICTTSSMDIPLGSLIAPNSPRGLNNQTNSHEK